LPLEGAEVSTAPTMRFYTHSYIVFFGIPSSHGSSDTTAREFMLDIYPA